MARWNEVIVCLSRMEHFPWRTMNVFKPFTGRAFTAHIPGMSAFLSILLLFLHFHGISASNPVAVEYMYPNSSISTLLYLDTDGYFITSRYGSFTGHIYRPGNQQSRYYLSILHAPTKTQVWTANRNKPMHDRSDMVKLSPDGLSIELANGTLLWSTPPLKAPVAAMRLLETGNLVLLDAAGKLLWESFNYPSDTLLYGQRLPVGSYLSSSISSDSDLSQGDFRLDVTPADAKLNWLNTTYWRLSNDINSLKDKDVPVAVMTTNDSGLYLLQSNGDVAFQVPLPIAPFRIVQLDSDGQLQITSYPATNTSTTVAPMFVAPRSQCDLPLYCGLLGLCLQQQNSSSCTCPPQFASATQSDGCKPGSDVLLAPDKNCDRSKISYTFVGIGVTYFGNKYRQPTTSGKNISDCRGLCSTNCSCSGYFFNNASRSCFLLQHPLGSLTSTNTSDSENAMAYIKTQGSNSDKHSSENLVPILVPSVTAIFLVVVAGLGLINCSYRRQKQKLKESRMAADSRNGPISRQVSDSDYLFSENGADMEEMLIPGLPTRFTFQQLEEITNNFLTKIGSGGFGSVYKGELFDKSGVAVKKIEAAGLHGRKEFCTEIAVIGNIHHVNLVRLRGYCAQSSHRLLVYEYMNRGSLDRSLFRPTGETLAWDERMNIAIGAARGLAYLHAGCQPKVLHCDIKPENILLDDQGQVKIADFGLAKLLTPEQSGLFTTMRGTRGYLAPEWLANTAISDRTDVYSFGMVLLELVRGRKNRSEHINAADADSKWSVTTAGSTQKGHEYFPLVALHMHEKKCYADLADPRLEGKFDVSEVELLVKTALCCLHEQPPLRPSMTSVVAMLEGTMEVWEPRVESLGFLRLYGQGVLGASSNAGTFETEDELIMNKVIGGSNMTSVTTSGWPSFMSTPQLSGPR